MSTEAQHTAQDAPPQPPAEAATEPDAPPIGQDVPDTWAEAADESGTVRSTRRMPEPDSRGG